MPSSSLASAPDPNLFCVACSKQCSSKAGLAAHRRSIPHSKAVEKQASESARPILSDSDRTFVTDLRELLDKWRVDARLRATSTNGFDAVVSLLDAAAFAIPTASPESATPTTPTIAVPHSSSNPPVLHCPLPATASSSSEAAAALFDVTVDAISDADLIRTSEGAVDDADGSKSEATSLRSRVDELEQRLARIELGAASRSEIRQPLNTTAAGEHAIRPSPPTDALTGTHPIEHDGAVAKRRRLLTPPTLRPLYDQLCGEASARGDPLSSVMLCWRCCGLGHRSLYCKNEAKCHSCHRPGHQQHQCRSPPKGVAGRLPRLADPNPTRDESDPKNGERRRSALGEDPARRRDSGSPHGTCME